MFVLSEVLVTRISLAGTSEFVIFPVQPPSLHSHHPSYSRTQHPLLPSPLLVSLLQFTLHGCLVPNACRLLWVFITRHNFSSPFIWHVCSPSTICFIFLCPLFSQRSIPSVPGDGFFKCLFYSLCLCGFPWITKLSDEKGETCPWNYRSSCLREKTVSPVQLLKPHSWGKKGGAASQETSSPTVGSRAPKFSGNCASKTES